MSLQVKKKKCPTNSNYILPVPHRVLQWTTPVHSAFITKLVLPLKFRARKVVFLRITHHHPCLYSIHSGCMIQRETMPPGANILR